MRSADDGEVEPWPGIAVAGGPVVGGAVAALDRVGAVRTVLARLRSTLGEEVVEGGGGSSQTRLGLGHRALSLEDGAEGGPAGLDGRGGVGRPSSRVGAVVGARLRLVLLLPDHRAHAVGAVEGVLRPQSRASTSRWPSSTACSASASSSSVWGPVSCTTEASTIGSELPSVGVSPDRACARVSSAWSTAAWAR